MEIYNFIIDNAAGSAVINIDGAIGSFASDDSVTTYSAFTTKIAEINKLNVRKVVVNIRSTGGDVQDALLIYDSLKALNTKVVTNCYGYTASAATIIAQAATAGNRKMSANGLYLIHRASTHANGNAAELDATADLLKKTDERIATIYAASGKLTAAEYAEIMGENNGKGRWLTAEEALEYGLIDEIINATTITNEFNPEALGLPALPQNHLEMENNTTPVAEKLSVTARFLAWLGITNEAQEQDFEAQAEAKEVEVQNITAERDAAVENIATLNATIETLNATIAERDETIAAKEVEINNLMSQLAEAKAMAVQATTTAQEVHDPEPAQVVTKTPNQAAYEADLAAFK